MKKKKIEHQITGKTVTINITTLLRVIHFCKRSNKGDIKALPRALNL